MLINRAYKFRIYPDNNQKDIINKTFGCTRLVYNYYLGKKHNLYKNEHKNISIYDCIKDIPNLYEERPYLKEVDSCSLRCALFDLDNSYNKFFKETNGYPKYKSKYDKNSYRTNLIISTYKNKTYENIKIDLINKTITLPKLKNIKIRGYRHLEKINGRIINVTISKELDGKYYVSVIFEEDIVISPAKSARLYTKIKNARSYIIHDITKKLTDENDIIVTENLKLKNMIKNHHLAKSLTDASLSEIVRQLEYKSKWKGKILYKVDTYFPSSQICSKCGYQNIKVQNLNIREYECPACHNYLDRDYN